MNMDFCGIFRVAWQNKNHVFQARLLEHLDKNKDFKKYRNEDSNFLSSYNSEYGRPKQVVRDDNLERSYEMLENSIKNAFGDEVEEDKWEELKKVGMRDSKLKK